MSDLTLSKLKDSVKDFTDKAGPPAPAAMVVHSEVEQNTRAMAAEMNRHSQVGRLFGIQVMSSHKCPREIAFMCPTIATARELIDALELEDWDEVGRIVKEFGGVRHAV